MPNILAFYRQEGTLPDAFTAHYADGGLSGVLLEEETGIPFTWTGHLAWRAEDGSVGRDVRQFGGSQRLSPFRPRIVAERLSMNRSAVNITSTRQERFEQYAHHAHRDAVDVRDDRRFAVIAPGVNLQIFDHDVVNDDEVATQAYMRAMLRRDLDAERVDLLAIVAASRLDPKKNHIGLIRAFAESPDLQASANLCLSPARSTTRYTTPGPHHPREVLKQIHGVIEEHHLWGKISAFVLRGQRALAAPIASWHDRSRSSRLRLTMSLWPGPLGGRCRRSAADRDQERRAE